MNAAFDVGADDGFHGIMFAFMNPKIKVFAFEPIKGSKNKIFENLRKIEKFFKLKITNYKIINVAVSDFNGKHIFYETDYKVASSLLKPEKKLNKFWTNSTDHLFKTVVKGTKTKKCYKVKVLTLEKFCKKKNICSSQSGPHWSYVPLINEKTGGKKRSRKTKRRKIKVKNLKNLIPIQPEKNNYSGHHLYVIRLNFEKIKMSKAELMNTLKAIGIGSQVHYIPLPIHPYFQNLGFNIENYPNSKKYYKEALSIPLYYDLTDEKHDYIINIFEKFISFDFSSIA